eukprot:5850355-Alexandrium_andersonii.AAC.1
MDPLRREGLAEAAVVVGAGPRAPTTPTGAFAPSAAIAVVPDAGCPVATPPEAFEVAARQVAASDLEVKVFLG